MKHSAVFIKLKLIKVKTFRASAPRQNKMEDCGLFVCLYSGALSLCWPVVNICNFLKVNFLVFLNVKDCER